MKKTATISTNKHFPSDAIPDGFYRKFGFEVARATLTEPTMAFINQLVTYSASLRGKVTALCGQWEVKPNLYTVIGSRVASRKTSVFSGIALPYLEVSNERLAEWKQKTLPRAKSKIALIRAEMERLKRRKRTDEEVDQVGTESPAMPVPTESEPWCPPAIQALLAEMCEVKNNSGGADSTYSEPIFPQNASSSSGDSEKSVLDLMTDLQMKLDEAEMESAEPVLYAGDVTSQKLESLLADNGGFIYSVTHEGKNAIANILGRHANGESEDGVYLECFDGLPLDVQRVGRRVHVDSAMLALNWMVATERFKSLIGNREMQVGGFVSRCILYNNTDPMPPTDLYAPRLDPSLRATWKAHLKENIERFSAMKVPLEVQFSAQAVALFQPWIDKLDRRLETSLQDIGNMAARWRDLVARVAVVLHCMKHRNEEGRYPISDETMMAALRIGDWQTEHQISIWEPTRVQMADSDWMLVEGLLKKHTDAFTIRDVRRGGSALIKSVGGHEKLAQRLDQFIQAGKLVGISVNAANGKPTTYYLRNVPSIIDSFRSDRGIANPGKEVLNDRESVRPTLEMPDGGKRRAKPDPSGPISKSDSIELPSEQEFVVLGGGGMSEEPEPYFGWVD